MIRAVFDAQIRARVGILVAFPRERLVKWFVQQHRAGAVVIRRFWLARRQRQQRQRRNPVAHIYFPARSLSAQGNAAPTQYAKKTAPAEPEPSKPLALSQVIV